MKTMMCVLLAIAASAGSSAPARADDANHEATKWAAAKAKFEGFISPVIKDAQQKLKDPLIHFVQVKRDLVSKYLPDVQLYVRDGAYYADDSMIWILNKDGQIADLGNGLWTGQNGNEWFAVEKSQRM